jgi:hypothetical protein
MYEEDLQKLVDDSNKKDIKLKELMKTNEISRKNIEQLEAKMEEVVEENRYLNECVKKMTKELKALEEFKSSIFESIKTNESKGGFKADHNDSIIYKSYGHDKKTSFTSELSNLTDRVKNEINYPSVSRNSRIIKDNNKIVGADRKYYFFI